MSGLVAVWNLDGRPVDPVLLNALAEPLAAGAGPCLQGPLGLAAALHDVAAPPGEPPAGPLRSPDGLLLAFDGRLDDRAELARLAGAGRELRDAELVLAAYRTLGEPFLQRLAGDFALVIFDPRVGRLLLARDAVGPRPLVWARVGSSVLVASEAKSFLRHPEFTARPNVHHLGEYLLGAAPQSDGGLTFLEGVETVRPGHRVRLGPDGMDERRFWDFAAEPLRLGSREDYRVAFREHFHTAVGRRLRGARPAAVAVSGGVDSSSIYCAAAWLRTRDPALPPLEGLTEAHPGDPHADEVAYVEEMEAMYGTRIHRLPGGGVGTLESWSRQVWHTETPQLHPFANAVEDRNRFARSLGAVTLIGGEWADAIVFDQSYLVDLARRGAWGTVRRHLATIPAWFRDADPAQFRAQFRRDLARSLLPASAQGAARWLRGRLAPRGEDALFARAPAFRNLPRRPEDPAAGRDFPGAHARSLYARVRSRRAALDVGALSRYSNLAGLRYALPFLDRELLAFLMSIPGDAMTPDGIPKGLLRASMRGRMPESIVERRWKADFTHLVQDGLKRYLVTLTGFLRAGTASVDLGLVDGDALHRLLQAWEAEGSDERSYRFWSVLQVLGLELWLQAILAGRPIVHSRSP